ncbi:MAG: AarF/ABC1/UbiB kinase family protein [Pseudanabaenaceae cyanobacterium bins.68]|nr:AarF/ABC1/UbiB kinase family protein [Pseudanabaenaceae cyanobacterium bins.68]
MSNPVPAKLPAKLKWQRQQISPWSRQVEVFYAALSFLCQLWWDQFWRNSSSSQRQRRARWLVKQILDLGPSFIKVGQSLSTRVDLLPPEYVSVLSELTDRVPSFAVAEAIAVIEAELGQTIYSIYRDFDPQPLAAASLGQVHRARLHTGEEVVVKIQRPGLKQLFDLDSLAVLKLLKFLQRYWAAARKYELEGIYQEFFRVLYQEIDYLHEAKNAERFRQNFAGYAQIVVPKVYWQYSSAKVLTLEFVPGIKVDQRAALEQAGIDPKQINQLGICCYLKQFLQDGFFHADPHPGNLAVTSQGSLVFYDYGMMAEVPALSRDQMVKSFLAILRKDTNGVVDTLLELGLIMPVGDLTPVKRIMKFVLDKFTEKPVDVRAFEEMRSEIIALFESQPFRLPAKMTYVLKSLTTLDGIARILDPDYNFTAAAQPFVRSLAVQSGGNLLVSLAQQTRGLIRDRLNQPDPTLVLIKRLEERLERGELEIQVKSLESDRALKRLDLAVKVLIHVCVMGFSLVTAAVLMVGQLSGLAIAAACLAAFSGWGCLQAWLAWNWRQKLDQLAEK